MSRRKYVLLLLGAFALCVALLFPMLGDSGGTELETGGLFGEQQQPSENTNEDDIATIRVSVSMSEAEFQYWQTLNEQFESRHPQLKVVLANSGKSFAPETWKTTQSDEPSDVLLLDNNQVRAFAVQGYLLPADELYSGDSLADQMEALTEPLKWNGAMWGVPLDWNPMLVVWQTELLKKMGMDQPPAKWDDFAAGYNALKAGRPDIRAVDIGLNDPRQMAAWLGQFQGSAKIAANLQPLDAAMKEQLRFLGQNGVRQEGSRPEQPEQDLANEKLLSAVVSWTSYRAFAASHGATTAIGLQGPPPAWLGGRSFVLTAQTKRLDEARMWIGEMTTASAQLDRYNELGPLPARKSLYMVEFELGRATNRPPYWTLGLLRKRAFEPDPLWQERWERWSALWSGVDANSFDAAAAEQTIRQWNGTGDKAAGSGKTAADTPPGGSKADG